MFQTQGDYNFLCLSYTACPRDMKGELGGQGHVTNVVRAIKVASAENVVSNGELQLAY